MYEKKLVSELEKMNGKLVNLSVDGVISTEIIFDKFYFEIVHDIIRFKDDNNNYFLFNINQVTKINIDNYIKIFTDSDFIIQINEIKKNA